jgi:ferredoxin-type protein NapF
VASRRDFFRSLSGGKSREEKKEEELEDIIRPPYALSESLFLSRCVECEDKACATFCEEKIIVIRADGTPTLNFSKKGCTFCEECAKACKDGVLSLENGFEQINANFLINIDGCVAHHKVICFSCKEPCIDDAILFNGMFNPVIDSDRCTSCGYCFGRCPTIAIAYKATNLDKMLENLKSRRENG